MKTVEFCNRAALSNFIHNTPLYKFDKCQFEPHVKYQLDTGTTLLHEGITILELKNVVCKLQQC